GIAVPVPSPAKVTGMVDMTEAGDTGAAQMNSRKDAGPASTENSNVDLLRQFRAGGRRRVRVCLIGRGEIIYGPHILVLPFGAHALVAFLAVLFLQGGDVDFTGCWQ